MDNTTIAYLVAALLIGAGVGVGIGYVAFHTDDGANDSYSIYLDYGDKADATHVNGWYTANGSDYSVAMKAAMDKAGLKIELDSYGGFADINGIVGDGSTTSWITWQWTANKFDSNLWGWNSTSGPGTEVSNVIYVGFTEYTFSESTMKYEMNPNATTAWKTGGPFATA